MTASKSAPIFAQICVVCVFIEMLDNTVYRDRGKYIVKFRSLLSEKSSTPKEIFREQIFRNLLFSKVLVTNQEMDEDPSRSPV